jgi:pyruvate kinase
MRRQRNAKIIATFGPASSDLASIRAPFEAGADVFRFNFSHGSHADHQARYEIVRQVERELGRPIAVLADLQGPKLRVGQIDGGKVMLPAGAEFTLDRDPTSGSAQRVCLPHPVLFDVITVGQSLLLDDGKLRLQVLTSDGTSIRTRVLVGGMLSDRKGVNVPDAVLPIPALTAKDLRDLEFALSLGVEWVALSFVQRPEDLTQARELVGDRAGPMTKLEKPQALDQLDEIVRLSDSVMVARGDLGVELPPERVPGVQKRILRACKLATARRLALVWGVHSTVSPNVARSPSGKALRSQATSSPSPPGCRSGNQAVPICFASPRYRRWRSVRRSNSLTMLSRRHSLARNMGSLTSGMRAMGAKTPSPADLESRRMARPTGRLAQQVVI